MEESVQPELARYRVMGISAFHQPMPGLVTAVQRAGALGILDCGEDTAQAIKSCDELIQSGLTNFGIIPRGGLTPASVNLPTDTIVVLAGPDYPTQDWEGFTIFAQVTSLEEALIAQQAGVDGLIAKGSESAGRVGTDTAFMLFQKISAAVQLPIWVQGGIGLHTATACIAGGANGIVLEGQLALTKEALVPGPFQELISTTDEINTEVIDSFRVLKTAPNNLNDSDAKSTSSKQPQALPAGNELSLATDYRQRFRTAGSLVHAFLRHIDKALNQAAELRSLSPHSALALEHDIEFPVFQGPMTRVSDVPEFANAVSSAGGLPFLALSMLRGKQIDSLLRESTELMQGRSWGVGLLGFLPKALRDEQMQIILEHKPPVALIAGGRPGLARPLEEAGIKTYLHVPSPGLLEIFLKDGARRFVFEGRECGGHVGPESSFTLWERQLEILTNFPKPEELCIVFAGGIHDARSAAMVSAMAAPLAAAGAKIGVLMGSAYLFSKEIVESGAILPEFQKVSLECKQTSLLETAPGHVTRCSETDYVQQFRDEKERLFAKGLSSKEVWEYLEMLNLGRLRIASKGVRREGEQLVNLDTQHQRSEGMYMIGEAATLHDKVIPVKQLHRDVSENAMALLQKSEAPPQQATTEVAIIGMACAFPGADDLQSYWSNIVQGGNYITEVDPERWNPDFYYDPASLNGDKTPSKWGGFIDDVTFDPLDYGIPPQSLTAIDTTQLLSLEMARRALADADYLDREFDRESVSVIFGAESGADIATAYSFRALYPQLAGEIPQALDTHLPRLTEDSFPGVLANVIAGRIANRLDLRGSNFTVDAACASSLAALDMAVKELTTGSSDMVLCGGADMHNGINDYLMFAGVGALSRNGSCSTFDAGADGIALGEGVACLVLKRLEDAERDGDRVYAVVRSVAGSSDGRSLGLTAPRREGQALALQRAYSKAAISPKQIGMIEAHGTGTVVGDRTELQTLTQTFIKHEVPAGRCALGSVKSQIGHTKCAAGLAGVIKAAMAVHTGILPPTSNLKKPNEAYDPDSSPFTLNQVARPWLEQERRAGISAFGFGGSNFHTVLESYAGNQNDAAGLTTWNAELFLLRGNNQGEALSLLKRLRTLLQKPEPPPLNTLAATVYRAGKGDIQFAMVAASHDELSELLDKVESGKFDNSSVILRKTIVGKIAFIFPGQGSQRINMLHELFIAFPKLRSQLQAHEDCAQAMFPNQAWDESHRKQQAQQLNDTRMAQPALGIAGLAAYEVLRDAGVQPQLLAGHSYGELVALCCAGAMTPEQLIALSRERANAILAAAGNDPGGMAAVSAPSAQVSKLLESVDTVVIANINAPEQTVISGPHSDLDKAISMLESSGLSTKKLPVACAFHSPVIAEAEATFREYLHGLPFHSLEANVWSNRTARTYPENVDAIKDEIAKQLASPVRFAEQIQAMYENGARLFVEVGPGAVLSRLMEKTLPGNDHQIINCDSGSGEIKDILRALARLAGAGVDINPNFLFQGRVPSTLTLEDLEAQEPSPTAWLINGWLARPAHGEPPENRLRPTPHPVIQGGVVPGVASADYREEMVTQYLRNLREMANAQRDVMLSFLGEVEIKPAVLAPAQQHNTLTQIEPQAPEPTNSKRSSLSLQPLDTALLDLVAEKTGYPKEMLDLDQDLEAELSIDSIKRLEILSELMQEYGLTDDDSIESEDLVEELAACKTLREILSKLENIALPEAETSEIDTCVETVDIPATLITLVQEKTGYPKEMLDMTADLEAELSIDSIKRIEILGAMADQLGLSDGGLDEDLIEELASLKTLEEICNALETHKSAVTGDISTQAKLPTDNTETAERYHAFPQPISQILDNSNYRVKDKKIGLWGSNHPLAEPLINSLKEAGAHIASVKGNGDMANLDGLLILPTSDTPFDLAKNIFPVLQSAVQNTPDFIIALTHYRGWWEIDKDTALEECDSLGLAGMFKTLKKEYPETTFRVVHLADKKPNGETADYISREIVDTDNEVEVAYLEGQRYGLKLAPAKFLNGTTVEKLLSDDSVVLVTGGARGITAQVLIGLAKQYPCRYVLVGRSPLPAEDMPLYPEAKDAASLRAELIRVENIEDPKEVEARCRSILAAREIRATLQDLTELGALVDYHSLDVQNDDALRSLIKGLYEKYGHIDAVIHGAGRIEDKLSAEKSVESFARVFDTKVKPLRIFHEELRSDLKLLVLFSSVSGVFGNRGQVDYSAAGDLFDKYASLARNHIEGRVLSIDWGPWGGSGGMVSDALAQAYQKRGVGLIEPQDGVTCFLNELAHGGKSEYRVAFFAGSMDQV